MENKASSAGVVRRIALSDLTLSFDPEMGSGFLEGDFDLPTAHEPGEDVARTCVEMVARKGLRFELAFGIANEQPADWHWRGAVRDTRWRAAGDFDDAVGSAVPETDA